VRVVEQLEGERNYHVLYQLLKGATREEIAGLKVRSPSPRRPPSPRSSTAAAVAAVRCGCPLAFGRLERKERSDRVATRLRARHTRARACACGMSLSLARFSRSLTQPDASLSLSLSPSR
jgi:hypothetical protein